MQDKPTVIFDCMIFLQAVVNPSGPAGECYQHVADGNVLLVISEEIIKELTDVVNRPDIRRKFPKLSDERVRLFLDELQSFSQKFQAISAIFKYPRDPKDEKYINLAIAAHAKVIVTRDNDLLDLMKPDYEDGIAFRQAYPEIAILSPNEFLDSLKPPAA